MCSVLALTKSFRLSIESNTAPSIISAGSGYSVTFPSSIWITLLTMATRSCRDSKSILLRPVSLIPTPGAFANLDTLWQVEGHDQLLFCTISDGKYRPPSMYGWSDRQYYGVSTSLAYTASAMLA